MPAANVSYPRTREMTIDEMLLENRVIFLVGEINHVSATGVVMRMLSSYSNCASAMSEFCFSSIATRTRPAMIAKLPTMLGQLSLLPENTLSSRNAFRQFSEAARCPQLE